MRGDLRAQRGFTLIELIVVIALMGVVMLVSAPLAMKWRTNAQYREAARTVANMMQEARSLAISDGEAYKIECNPASSVCSLEKATLDASLSYAQVYSYAYPKKVLMRTGTNCNQTTALELEFFPNGRTEMQSGPTPPPTVCVNESASERRFRVGLESTGKVTISK